MKALPATGLIVAFIIAAPLAGQRSETAYTPIDVRPNFSTAQAAHDTTPFCCDRRRFLPTAAGIFLLEAIPWYFNMHFADDSTAILSHGSYWTNIRLGFEWDVDNFRTNMFMHPYHGAAYFNTARANGYDFWESSAFPWIGSFLFEFFGERNRPAINDWINTSAGGIVIGESFHRLARMIRDNEAIGAARAGRELGALPVDPAGSLFRLVRGEMSRVGPNPADRFPVAFRYTGKLGFRVVSEGEVDIQGNAASAFAEFFFQYGDPMEPLEHPFDDFLMTVQLNSRESEILGRLQIEGSLFRRELARTGGTDHLFNISLHYDYVNNLTYEIGGQSVGAGVNSEWRLSDDWTIRTRAQAIGTIIAGIGSEYAGVTGRSYDFGSGAGLRLFGVLSRRGFPVLETWYIGSWIHTMNGATGNHIIHFPAVIARVPLPTFVGLGAEFIYAVRNSFYRDFDDVYRRNPQVRFFVTIPSP